MKTLCCHTRKVFRIENKPVCANADCSNYLGAVVWTTRFSSRKILVAFTLFFFVLVFTLEDFSMGDQQSAKSFKIAGEKSILPLTIFNLQKELEKQKIICADAVLAQMRLESGNFTSGLLKRTNNMLGMRYPLNRETAACGIYLSQSDTIIFGTQEELKKFAKSDNYSVYRSWLDAVKDYRLWQQSEFNVEERYLRFLGSIYAEDSLYVKKIRQLAVE